MAHSCRRYDISDAVCSLLELHLPKRLRRISQRKSSVHIHVVFLIMRTGHRGRIYYRIMVIGAMRTAVLFARVCGKDLLEVLIDDSDYERIMIVSVIAKLIPMPPGLQAEIRTWVAQKRVQQQNTSGSGCALFAGWSRLWQQCDYWAGKEAEHGNRNSSKEKPQNTKVLRQRTV